MKSFFALLAAVAAILLTSGCATGVPYASMASSIPPLNNGQGRIFFFRSSSMLGAALTPEIRLNDEVVGNSKIGGFFFVDRPAGTYKAATATEVEKTLSFSLEDGEIKYVRSSVTLGVVVGRVVLELEEPQKAMGELATLNFTGAINPTRSAVAARQPVRTTASTRGKTTLDDLRGLLPASK